MSDDNAGGEMPARSAWRVARSKLVVIAAILRCDAARTAGCRASKPRRRQKSPVMGRGSVTGGEAKSWLKGMTIRAIRLRHTTSEILQEPFTVRVFAPGQESMTRFWF